MYVCLCFRVHVNGAARARPHARSEPFYCALILSFCCAAAAAAMDRLALMAPLADCLLLVYWEAAALPLEVDVTERLPLRAFVER